MRRFGIASGRLTIMILTTTVTLDKWINNHRITVAENDTEVQGWTTKVLKEIQEKVRVSHTVFTEMLYLDGISNIGFITGYKQTTHRN